MHRKILSKREEEVIRRFLESGEKLDGFSLLKSRAKKLFKEIERDYELLKAFVEKTCGFEG
ncbi:MAG: hypothetical protein QXF29_06075 [Archaeoglobaceae archaeon]